MEIIIKVNLQEKRDENGIRLFIGPVHNVFILVALNEQGLRTHKYFVKNISTTLGAF